MFKTCYIAITLLIRILINEIKCLKNQKYKVNIQQSRVNTDLYKKLEVGSGAMEE